MQRLSSCIGFWNTLTLSSRACFGIFVFFFAEDGGPLTDNVVFSSDQRILASVQRVSVLKRTAVVWVRSRIGALRDDRVSGFWGRLYGMSVLLPSRHPDNAPGQGPYPSRKRDHRSRSVPIFARSVQRFFDRDAETSSA